MDGISSEKLKKSTIAHGLHVVIMGSYIVRERSRYPKLCGYWREQQQLLLCNLSNSH